jgi:hypothetical protein
MDPLPQALCVVLAIVIGYFFGRIIGSPITGSQDDRDRNSN